MKTKKPNEIKNEKKEETKTQTSKKGDASAEKKEEKQTKPSAEEVKNMESTQVETPSDTKEDKGGLSRANQKPSNTELSYSIGKYEGNKKLFWDFDKNGNVAFSNTSQKPPFVPPEFNED